MPSRSRKTLPALHRLYQRHPGLTRAVCLTYAEAVGVCLSRYYEPPVVMSVEHVPNGARTPYGLTWRPPGPRQRTAWANVDDATRDGAYAVALATAGAEFGLLAVLRAETRTGANYYLGPGAETQEVDDLEKAYRLEVAGVDRGSRTTVRQRLHEKAA